MNPDKLPNNNISHATYLFSEEELQNISALLIVLKKIHTRLKKDGIDIDKFTKENGVSTPFDK